MRVYIAAPWDDRDKVREIAKQFEERGHKITHDWWNHDVPGNDEAELVECADADLDAIIDADVFVLLNTQKRGEETSGKAVELGIALVLCHLMPQYCIMATGIKGTNVFQLLPEVEWFDSVEGIIGALDD